MNNPQVKFPPPFDINELEKIVGAPAIHYLRLLARRLQKNFHGRNGKIMVWHINSCGWGGGVADILSSLVPLSTGLGIPSRWFIIGGDKKFFDVTKTFHNALQGASDVEINDEMVSHYQRVVAANARILEQLTTKRRWSSPDVVVLHDPQPAPLISHWRSKFPDTIFVWRGHIQFDVAAWGLSHPGRRVWELLVGFINQCDAAVFHLPEQVPPGIEVPVRFILPSINPFGFINRDLNSPVAAQFIDSTLSKYGMENLQDRSIPLVIQNARFDAWKDPFGVIQAFREARECLPKNRKQPYLLLLGPLAGDDPEAHGILAQLGQLKDGDSAVHILPVLPNGNGATIGQVESLRGMGINHRRLRPEDLMELEINAFQTRADIIVAKSLREGFGLNVTGAGYHGKPRIVSQVGGLSAQVIDGKGTHTAYLVGGAPHFSREVSIAMTRDWIVKLLGSQRLRRSMGARAKRHVTRNFLPHRHLEDYLRLFLDLSLSKISGKGTVQRPDSCPAAQRGDAPLRQTLALTAEK